MKGTRKFSPYTVPVSKIASLVDYIRRKTIRVRIIARTILESPEFTKNFPEDLRNVVGEARIREVAKEGDGVNFLADKLKKEKRTLIRLLRLTGTDELLSKCTENTPEREVIEVKEPHPVKICIDYYREPFFDFKDSSRNPITDVKVNRKTKTVYLRALGSCQGVYNDFEYSRKDSSITVSKNVTTLKDHPYILIMLSYFVKRYYDDFKYGYHKSLYYRQYGIIYNCHNRDAVLFRFKISTCGKSDERLKNIKTVSDLLEVLPPQEKEKVKAWIKNTLRTA